MRTKGGNGAARSVSAGNSGGMRKTTLVPERGGSVIDKSPATPAANDKVDSASATARTRMVFETAKGSER